MRKKKSVIAKTNNELGMVLRFLDVMLIDTVEVQTIELPKELQDDESGMWCGFKITYDDNNLRKDTADRLDHIIAEYLGYLKRAPSTESVMTADEAVSWLKENVLKKYGNDWVDWRS